MRAVPNMAVFCSLLLLLLLLSSSSSSLPIQHHHREDTEIYRLQEELTRICQPRAIYIVPLALSTTGIIPSSSIETT
jgi:hypothetical protein